MGRDTEEKGSFQDEANGAVYQDGNPNRLAAGTAEVTAQRFAERIVIKVNGGDARVGVMSLTGEGGIRLAAR